MKVNKTMVKQDLLQRIADTAYNVGFGAKKHFASFDIVDKAPGRIGFISMAVGVLGLTVDALSTKLLAAIFTVIGIAGLYISIYESSKSKYEEAGVLLTKLFNELKTLYLTVKSSQNTTFSNEEQILSDIEDRYYKGSISKQILLSDWYAHYKFFWQHQIDWLDEQKKFKFWRDKVPLSLSLSLISIILTIIILLFTYCL